MFVEPSDFSHLCVSIKNNHKIQSNYRKYVNLANFILKKYKTARRFLSSRTMFVGYAWYNLTIIPRARVGYEMVDSQRDA